MTMKHDVSRRLVLALGLLVAAGAMAMPAAAAQPEHAPAEAPPANDSRPAQTAPDQDSAPAPAAGMLAFRDPVTGQLRPPTEAELEAIRPQLEALFNQSSEGLQEIVLDDGTVGVDLQGRFQTAVVAVVAEDGTVTTRCVTSREEIAGLLTPAENAATTDQPASGHQTAVK
jgi:hypothetical protein